jgi:hypothetical protein
MAEEQSKKHERAETEEEETEQAAKQARAADDDQSDQESEDLSGDARKKIGPIAVQEIDRLHRVITVDEDHGIVWMCIPEDFWVTKVQTLHARYLEAVNRKSGSSLARANKGDSEALKAARKMRAEDQEARHEFHELLFQIRESLPSAYVHPVQDKTTQKYTRPDSHDFDPVLLSRIAADHFVICHAFDD